MRIGDVGSAIGKGLVAGAVGTVVMTAGQKLAQRLLHEQESSAPASAAEKLLEVEPEGPGGEKRLNYVVHFLYGAAWGIPRALLELVGLRGTVADATHFGAIQAAAWGVGPTLSIGPPPTEWPKQQLALGA